MFSLLIISLLPALAKAAVSPGYLAAPVENCGEYYCMPNVSVGIPTPGSPQYQSSFVVDTGSGELWTHTAGDGFNIGNTVGGSSNVVNSSFEIYYTDGVYHSGVWMNQPVSIAGVQMTTLMGGVDLTSGAMMGLAPVANSNGSLSNILQSFISSNTIATPAFSLYLDPTVPLWSYQQNNAEVLFGAVDSSRFQTPLQLMPMSSDTTAYHVRFDSLQVQVDGSGNFSMVSNTPMTILLDSGMPAIVLPSYLADAVANIYGGSAIPGTLGTQSYGYTCNNAAVSKLSQATFKFTFGSVNIAVPLSSLVIDPYKNGTCILSIANYGNTTGAIFGNSFLRNTYTVFDPLNHQIAMAQATPAGTQRSIQVITNSTLPFVTGSGSGTVTPSTTPTANAAADTTAAPSASTSVKSSAMRSMDGGVPLVLLAVVLVFQLL